MTKSIKQQASQTVKEAVHKQKRGMLKSGRSGKTVRSRKQAVAIGLSQARRAETKVAPRTRSRKKQ